MERIQIFILQVLLCSCSGGGIIVTGSTEPGPDVSADHVIESEPFHDSMPFDIQEGETQDVGSGDTDMAEDGAPTDLNREEIVVGNCVGEPCTTDDQCGCVPSAARECMTSIYDYAYVTFPGGYCTAPCTTSSECGEAGRCAEITTGYRMCLKLCSRLDDCRMGEGYVCSVIPMSTDTNRYCLPTS